MFWSIGSMPRVYPQEDRLQMPASFCEYLDVPDVNVDCKYMHLD